jgi:tetratricopeptide (TPR) repeat protein
VRVWDAATGRGLLTLQGHTSAVLSVCFSPDGRRVISADNTGKQIAWDLQSGKPIPEAKERVAESSRRSPDGRHFAHVEGNLIRLVPLPTGDELVRRHPWLLPDPAWHDDQTREAEQQGLWFAAAFHQARLLRTRPWDAGLCARHAYALEQLGRTREAALHYLKAITLNPHVRLWPLDPQAATRGEEAARAGDWPRAAAEFRLAAHQPGAVSWVWYRLLLCRLAAGQTDACAGDCREMLDRHGRDPRAARDLAVVCQLAPCEEPEKGRFVQLARQLVAGKRNADHLHHLGVSLYRAGQYEEARKTLHEAIKAHGKGGYADSWLFLAMTLQRLGRPAEARTCSDKFESWLKIAQFDTWDEKTRWRLLHREAKELIWKMPRVPEGR